MRSWERKDYAAALFYYISGEHLLSITWKGEGGGGGGIGSFLMEPHHFKGGAAGETILSFRV